jgi:hypothetical protein
MRLRSIPKSIPAIGIAGVIAVSSLLVSLILLATNWHLLHTDIIPSGDAAADELLLIRARHGVLLHGHYSRFNFYHPGPFFFDVRLIADHIAAWLFPSPFTLHTATLMVVNGLFIGLTAALAFSLTGGGPAGWLAALGCVASVLFQFHNSSAGLTSSWMPDVIRMPYLAFLVALPLMARGSAFGLIAATFCGGALVHGYVAMPAFVAPPWLMALTLGLVSRHRRNQPFPLDALAASAGIVLLFVSPILVDMIFRPPGNIGLILDYMRQAAAENAPPNPPDDVSASVLGHWQTLNPLLWGLPILALLLDGRRWVDLKAWLPQLFFTLLSVLLFYGYLRTAPPPLYDYIGYFHDSVPLALVVWGVVRLAPRALAYRPAAAVALVLCLVGLAQGGGHSGNRGVPEIRPLTQAVVARHPGSQVMLRMAGFDEWTLMTGLMADLDRFGVDSCTPFLYPQMPEQSITHNRLCPEARKEQQRYVLTAHGACGPSCLADSPIGDIAVDDQQPAILSDGARHYFLFTSLAARRVLGEGWSMIEPWGVWSDGNRAEICLDRTYLGSGETLVHIDLDAFLAGTVTSVDVPVTVNGREVDHWHFEKGRSRGIRSLDLPASNGRVVIGFSGIGAQTPAMAGLSQDGRHLGLALYSLTIEPKSAP